MISVNSLLRSHMPNAFNELISVQSLDLFVDKKTKRIWATHVHNTFTWTVSTCRIKEIKHNVLIHESMQNDRINNTPIWLDTRKQLKQKSVNVLLLEQNGQISEKSDMPRERYMLCVWVSHSMYRDTFQIYTHSKREFDYSVCCLLSCIVCITAAVYDALFVVWKSALLLPANVYRKHCARSLSRFHRSLSFYLFPIVFSQALLCFDFIYFFSARLLYSHIFVCYSFVFAIRKEVTIKVFWRSKTYSCSPIDFRRQPDTSQTNSSSPTLTLDGKSTTSHRICIHMHTEWKKSIESESKTTTTTKRSKRTANRKK